MHGGGEERGHDGRADGGHAPPVLGERRRRPHEQERYDVEEVPVPDDVLAAEAQVVRGRLDREDHDGEQREDGEAVRFSFDRTGDGGEHPADAEEKRNEPAADGNLVEMRRSRSPDAGGQHRSVQRRRIDAERVAERTDDGDREG